MARPQSIPTWATDDTYVATGEAWDGAPTKVAPAPSKQAEGVEPGERFPADHFNWILNALGGFADHLADLQIQNWFARDLVAGSYTGVKAACFSELAVGAVFTVGLEMGASTDVIQRSPDGLNWLDDSTGFAGDCNGIHYFQAVSLRLIAGNSGRIWSQGPNGGGSWTQRGPGSGHDFRAIASSPTVAVAVGNSGRIYSSTDGTTWNSRTSGTTSNLLAVAYGNGLFVAVGEGLKILTSPDGTTWTVRTTGTGTFGHVVYEPIADRFVAFRSTSAVATIINPTNPSGPYGSVTLGSTPETVAVDGNGSIIAVFVGSVSRSTDGGATWGNEDYYVSELSTTTRFVGGACVYGGKLGYLLGGTDTGGTTPMLFQSLRAR